MPIGKTRWLPWPLIYWDIFDFVSETADRNSTKLDRKQDPNVLYPVCVFLIPSEKRRWPPWPSNWLRHFWLLLWTAEQNSTKLDRKEDLNVLYPVCVFMPFGKTRWLPWPLVGWDIFDFVSETAERNSTTFERKQDLNVLYQVRVLGWSEKQDLRFLSPSVSLSICHSVCPSVHSTSVHSFFFSRPWDIDLKFGRRLCLDITQIKWNFCRVWPFFFTWVIALCKNLVFRIFLSRLFWFWLEI